MPRLTLEPSPLELGLFREQYEGLIADLEANGFDVDLVEPVEYRGGLPLETLYDLTIHIGAVTGSLVALDALIERICKRVPGRMPGGKTRRVRRGVIHIPGEEPHEWDFPD